MGTQWNSKEPLKNYLKYVWKILFANTVPCRLNRLFGIFPYKTANFVWLEFHLNDMQIPPFSTQLLREIVKSSQQVLAAKFQVILDLQAL